MNNEEKRRVIDTAAILRKAESPLRILGSISWSADIKQRFFEQNARELPQVTYAAIDVTESLELVAVAREKIVGDSVVDLWLSRLANSIENTAKMLAAIGTPTFHEYSALLYGRPDDPLPNGLGTTSALAERVDQTLKELSGIDLGAPPPACHLATAVADKLEKATAHFFGSVAPEILIVDDLASNAIAGPKRIRIRRDACFTDRDADQLIQHEAYIHVATSLNGYRQENLNILGASHAGTTRTQEGLAVFAEFISGVMDTDRLSRLTARVTAIQMAINGANFLEVYDYFVERIGNEDQAFENTRRVFRGGTVTGGAPFTKDIVYLDGFVRVHSYLTEAIASSRIDALRLLFCGKLDIEDVPALSMLSNAGLCQPATFVPPWATDLRFLVAFLSYSDIFRRVNTEQTRDQQHQMLERTLACG